MRTKSETKAKVFGFVLLTALVILLSAAISSVLSFEEAYAAESYNGSCYRSGYFEFSKICGTFDELTLNQKNPSQVKQDTVYKFGTGKYYNSTISNLKMTATKDNKLILEYKIDTPFYSFFNGGTDIYPDIYCAYDDRYGNGWGEYQLHVDHWNENCDFASNKHVMIDFNTQEDCLLYDLGTDIVTAIERGDLEITMDGLTLIS